MKLRNFAQNKVLMGGLPVENIQYIYLHYIYSLSADLDFLYPLMSLDGNLFQLLPVLVLPIHPLGVLKDFLSLSYKKLPLSFRRSIGHLQLAS